MKKALTSRQKETLKRHAKHHSAKHMSSMKKDMMAGMSFTASHKKAMKKVGK
jgi:hypothetical protein|tara:strand:- start:3054 stop:3209 length:156 start_codon:yes stop_codon:yes gene_type:complete